MSACKNTVEVIDSSDDEEVLPSESSEVIREWIGNGKKATDTYPGEVEFYIRAQKKLPPALKSLSPKPALSIGALAHLPIPAVPSGVIFPRASSWWSPHAPNTDNSASLFRQSPPPRDLVKQLGDQFTQAILDGKRSICDPSSPNTRWPLHSITIWGLLVKISDAQRLWKARREWLMTKPDTTESRRALALLDALPWEQRIILPFTSSQNTTADFARLLSDDWINTWLVDLMLGQLAERLELDECLDEKFVIQSSELQSHLVLWQRNEVEEKWSPSKAWLDRVASLARTRETMVFVVYWKEHKHWVPVKVSMKNKQITYGDGLEGTGVPTVILKLVKTWLDGTGHKYNIPQSPRTVLCGAQNNFVDCGILAVNAIEHEIWQDPLWTPGTADEHHIRWFCKLAEAHLRSHKLAIPNIDRNRLTIASLLNATEEPQPRAMFANSEFGDAGVVLQDAPGDGAVASLAGSKAQAPMEVEGESSAPVSASFTAVLKRVRSRDAAGDDGANKKAALASDLGDPWDDSRSYTDSDADSEATLDSDDEIYCGYTKQLPGTSRAAVYHRKQNEKYARDPSICTAKQRKALARMTTTVLSKYDSAGEVIDSKHVRHSKCGKVQKLDAPFKLSNFAKHVKLHCNRPTVAGGTRSLFHHFAQQSSNPMTTKGRLAAKHPCPGLVAVLNAQIAQYLERTGASGGGGPTLTKLSRESFGVTFADLSSRRKREVRRLQQLEWRWVNDHESGAVHTTKCGQYISSEDGGPCLNCFGLLRLKMFRNAINKCLPDEENFKYNNKVYLHESTAQLFARSKGLKALFQDEVSPGLKYALAVINGHTTGEKGKQEQFFMDLLAVLGRKQRKAEKGKGMQGFGWSQIAPLLKDIGRTIYTISPAAFRALNTYIPLPNERTFQRERSKLPKFPVDFTPRTITLAKEHMDAMGWNGPLAMSCDDTKLQAAFRPFYDTDREGWCILGSVGVLMIIANPDEFRQAIVSGKVQKATKLRLWCLQVCCPGVPSYILAAKGIPETLRVPELFSFFWQLLTELIDAGLQICSYACDGTTTERNVQHMITEHAQSSHSHTIEDARPNAPRIVVCIPIVNGQPIALIQDDLHLRKTLRNNIFSGAKSRTFFRHTVHFAQVLRIAQNDGPVYLRDVIKLDRQDDNASDRLFNGDTMAWLIENLDKPNDDELALIVFLFVFGELIDTYQSRSIPIVERVRMILRAFYFLEYWETFLDVAGYAKLKHFLSNECVDIIRIFINGFFQLLFIHRDHLESTFPLFLHLVGTSLCEHVFGLNRKLDKDFTLYTFYQLKPKITLMLQSAIISADAKNVKARAAGYNFSYLDRHGVDAAALSIFPTDTAINEQSCSAHDDVVGLLSILGVDSAEELRLVSQAHKMPLAPISRWYSPETRSSEDDSDSDSEFDADADVNSPNVGDGGQLPLESALSQAEAIKPRTLAEEERLMQFRYAAISLAIAKDQQFSSLANEYENETRVHEYMAANAAAVGDLLANTLPAISLDQNPPIGQLSTLTTADLTILSKLRKDHETRLSAQASRSRREADIPVKASANPVRAAEVKLALEFQKIIHEYAKEERGEGTGLSRQVRHQTAPKGPDTSVSVLSGNAANAAAAATTAANTALTKRVNAYRGHPLHEYLGRGRISDLSPIQTSRSTGGHASFGFGVVGYKADEKHDASRIVLLQVHALYEGGSGRHNDVAASTNVCRLSNIVGQTYESLTGGNLFRPCKAAASLPDTYRFELFTSRTFLVLLETHPTGSRATSFRLSPKDFELYQQLSQHISMIHCVLKKMGKRKKGEHDIAED